jgi:hypothetical protein
MQTIINIGLLTESDTGRLPIGYVPTDGTADQTKAIQMCIDWIVSMTPDERILRFGETDPRVCIVLPGLHGYRPKALKMPEWITIDGKPYDKKMDKAVAPVSDAEPAPTEAELAKSAATEKAEEDALAAEAEKQSAENQALIAKTRAAEKVAALKARVEVLKGEAETHAAELAHVNGAISAMQADIDAHQKEIES